MKSISILSSRTFLAKFGLIAVATFPPKSIWIFNSNVMNHSVVWGEKCQMWEMDIYLKTMTSTSNTIPTLVRELQANI